MVGTVRGSTSGRRGQVVGATPVRIVTLDFLANGGDSYPFPAFVAANPTFANRVNLGSLGLPPGAATFANPGTEQDALAEYLLANHSTVPFAEVDTAAAADQRVQNLLARSEGVIAFVNPPFQIDLAQDLANCGPLALNVVGTLPNARLFNFVSFGCSSGTGPLFGVGGDAFFPLFLPLGFEPVHVRASDFGIYSWRVPSTCTLAVQLEAVAVEIDDQGGFGLPVLTRVATPTPCTSVSL